MSRRSLGLSLLAAASLAGCGGSSSGGRSHAEVVSCLQRAGLIALPPPGGPAPPTGLRYGLVVSLNRGQPPGPTTPEAVVSVFHTSDQAAHYAAGGDNRRGATVLATSANATRAQVKAVEACVF